MSFWKEIKQRNVFRVAVFYAVSAWLLLQVGDVLFGLLELPGWSLRLLAGLLVLGFPLVVILAWIYELTPEGVKRESEIDRSAPRITGQTGHKLDVATIAVGVVAIGLVVWQQFVAPTTETGQPTPLAETPTPADHRTAIAVLPFANLSGDDQAMPFTQGLHDDLLTRLSRLPDLKVVSRTSVLEYAGSAKNIRTIGQELGVSHIMEGGVQRAGQRVRINVQLIDASTDEHLWADTYDRELTVQNIFDLQSAISDRIADALKISFSAPASKADSGTGNLAAYEAFLRGRVEMETGDYSAESTERAMANYRRATELDPQFAEAWAGLATAYDNQYWFGGRKLEDREQIRILAERALQIDPDLSTGHLAMAEYFYHGHLDYDAALASLARAEEALRGSAHFLKTKAAVYRRMGDNKRAIPLFEEAVVLNPRGGAELLDLSFSYRAEKRFGDELAVVDRMEQLLDSRTVAYRRAQAHLAWRGDTGPLLEFQRQTGLGPFARFVELNFVLMALRDRSGPDAVDQFLEQLVAAGHLDETEANLQSLEFGAGKLDEFQPQVEAKLADLEAQMSELGTARPEIPLDVARLLAVLGRRDEARDMLEAALLEPWAVRDHLNGPGYQRAAAEVFAHIGDQDRALTLVESSVQADAVLLSLRAIMLHPWLAPLTSHPRFPELLDQVGWEWEDRSQGLPF